MYLISGCSCEGGSLGLWLLTRRDMVTNRVCHRLLFSGPQMQLHLAQYRVPLCKRVVLTLQAQGQVGGGGADTAGIGVAIYSSHPVSSEARLRGSPAHSGPLCPHKPLHKTQALGQAPAMGPTVSQMSICEGSGSEGAPEMESWVGLFCPQACPLEFGQLTCRMRARTVPLLESGALPQHWRGGS